MKKIKEYDLSTISNLMGSLTHFAQNFSHVSILSSNSYADKYGKYEILAAFGAKRLLSPTKDSLGALKQFYQEKRTWLFGHLAYDLKNELEDLESKHIEYFDFGNLSFFEPEILVVQEKGKSKLSAFLNEGVDPKKLETLFEVELKPQLSFPALKERMSKQDYLNAIRRLKEEIQYGNIYEINYCQEFYQNEVNFNPYQAYLKLWDKSQTPFGAFYKKQQDYLLCASPERYIAKRGEKIISQPIKGTAKRGKDKEEDTEIKFALRADLKEQTENVMIVDLVRNDLSRTAEKASVEVEELFGVYTFPQVHQLISTVKSKLRKDLHFTDVIKHSFPMGSMTGAPKISAMNLIEEHEKSRRGLYSGSVGYISPEGDFDFNVVIRSLVYSSKNNYLSLSVGGAITNMAEAEKEYEECLLKAKAIFDN